MNMKDIVFYRSGMDLKAKVYSFSELSQRAQKRVLDDSRSDFDNFLHAANYLDPEFWDRELDLLGYGYGL